MTLKIGHFGHATHTKITTERDMTQHNPPEPLIKELQDVLTRLHGSLLVSRDLWKVLGYASPKAYRQARTRKRVPMTKFEIEGRSGHFAVTLDVARWLTEQRLSVPQSNEEGVNK
jgi:hypothetical protein